MDNDNNEKIYEADLVKSGLDDVDKGKVKDGLETISKLRDKYEV